MAELGRDPDRERRAASRSCGTCSLCCTILRVDELAKPAGRDCVHQRGPHGCAIHATRPPICRSYRCLWLQGGLEDDERPDATGGVVDLEPTGVGLRLAIREGRPGAFDASPALQAIAERYRASMPVRITDTGDVSDPDRPFRVLLADGAEQRVAGERIDVYQHGALIESRRLPWVDGLARNFLNWWRERSLRAKSSASGVERASHRGSYGLFLALVSALLFGASTPASKLLLASLEPFQLAGLLYLGAALGMIPVVALERRRDQRARLDILNAARLAGAVLFGGVIGPVLLLIALRFTLSGSVSLLLNLEMVATAVLGVVFFREHLDRTGWFGVAGVVGAGVLVAGNGGWPGLAGALLTAAACVCWAIDNHLTALIDGITPARSTLVKGLVAGALNLSIGLAASSLAATSETIAAALAVGALCYGASIALYIAAAQDLGATRAQAVFASAPFVGAALAFVFLDEPVRLVLLAAAVLLVPSVAALFTSQHAHLHAHDRVAHTHGHRHDDGHHLHSHPSQGASLRHTHAHDHEPLTHAHPHWPDVHHRHDHTG